MKNLYLTLVTTMCTTLATFGQNYYWYKGAKIPLGESNMCYVVFNSQDSSTISSTPFVKKGIFRSSGKQDQMWGCLPSKNLNPSAKILYCSKAFKGSDKTTDMYVTPKFYVKLKKKEDYSLLRELVSKYDSEVEKEGAISLWYVVNCLGSNNNNALELANIFYESGMFSAVEPEFINGIKYFCANDSFFENQWNLNNTGQYGIENYGIDINFCNAHSITNGDTSIIIGVIDRAIQLNHPDLNIYSLSYDVESMSSPSVVYASHGTACAGIMGAKTNNNMGVAGIAPNCPLMSISTSDNTSADDFAKGFNFARNNNAAIISNSWGLTYESEYTEDAIDSAIVYGRNGKGCVVVFAAGNDGVGYVSYPARSNPDILVAGAMRPDGRRKEMDNSDGYYWGSNYGLLLDVMAPGFKLFSTAPNSDYMSLFGGTSAACPHVAAVAGLILSVNPYLTQKEVADIIESTAQKVGGYAYNDTIGRPNGTWHREMGYGLLDAYAAVLEAKNRFPIQGPDYYCYLDTTCFQLANLPDGATCVWRAKISDYEQGNLKIINGDSTSQIVCIKHSIPQPINPLGGRATNDWNNPNVNLHSYISVTITLPNNVSYTITKKLRLSIGDTPTIQASSNLLFWPTHELRTFVVNNCTYEPDSVFQWVTKRNGVIKDTHIGKTYSYTPINQGAHSISVTNLEKECGDETTTNTYYVIYSIHLKAINNGNTLNITICEEENDESPQLSLDLTYGTYTLELTHPIYGNMRSQIALSSAEQMDISSLPQGVYVLFLKENGNVVADTKVQIQ